MKTKVKRIYDTSAKNDGTRILVDRVWPRGVRKEDADLDAWLKILTPSTELRKWFHEDKEDRYSAFAEKYKKELHTNRDEITDAVPKKKTVTLVTAVKDIEHSHIPTLQKFLSELSV